MIDLRSDTVTKPTQEMRRAMSEAEVGDDVYGEDPSVNLLEALSAEKFGKEAGLFVPSGTMGNTIAIKLHTEHGQEVICDSRSHILDYELAMMAWFAGCVARPIATDGGVLSWSQIRDSIRRPGPHWAPTGLIAIENTHNMAGGRVYPLQALQEIHEGAREEGLPVHMDGARIFNAAIALSVPVATIAASADTIMFCFSKGLGAPVGSMLVGTREQMERGRLYRKRLGGGLRQAGVLAAAAQIGLEIMPERLVQDHSNARLIWDELAALEGIQGMGPVETNIVIFDVQQTGCNAKALSLALRERGVLANAITETKMRMVTHYDVSTEQCKSAVAALREVLEETCKC